MKITDMSRQYMFFPELNHGDVFKLGSETGDVYIKIANIADSVKFNAVKLESGYAYIIHENAKVIPCDAELVIRR